MFTLPQPPPDKPGTLPRVDVQDSPKAWGIILRTIYPALPNPNIDTLDDLESLMLAAQAYEMQYVIETHKKAFERREFIEKDPLRLFTIACTCGFEEQATYVARNAERLTVTRCSNPSDLKGLTFGAYCRLVSFLAERNNKWHETLEGAWVPWCYLCHSDSQSKWLYSFYNRIKKQHLRPYLQAEEVYIKALEDRSHCDVGGCYSDECWFGNMRIKEFIQGKIKEREKICDEFQPSKW